MRLALRGWLEREQMGWQASVRPSIALCTGIVPNGKWEEMWLEVAGGVLLRKRGHGT